MSRPDPKLLQRARLAVIVARAIAIVVAAIAVVGGVVLVAAAAKDGDQRHAVFGIIAIGGTLVICSGVAAVMTYLQWQISERA